jgi:hypothetical protein
MSIKPREIDISEIADSLDIRNEDGWHGAFTRNSVRQAVFARGERIYKARHEPGDSTPVGTSGFVLGSIYLPEWGVGYFVEWSNRPRSAIFVVQAKITNTPPEDL